MAAIVKIRWKDNATPHLTLTTICGKILDEIDCIPGIDFDWTVGESAADIEIEGAVERALQSPTFEEIRED